MQHALRPWITTGVALIGAGVITVVPVAGQLPEVQHQAVQLTSGAGYEYPLVDFQEMLDHTTDNLQGLNSIWSEDPFPLLTTPYILGGLVANLENFLTLSVETTPVAWLSMLGLLAFSPFYPLHAPIVGLVGIVQNMIDATLAGNFEAIPQNLLLAPTTLIDDFLNGYPVEVADNGYYLVDRPMGGLLAPEFGLLTNPEGATPLATGTLGAWYMTSKTIADQLAGAGGYVQSTDPLTLIGAGTMDIENFHIEAVLKHVLDLAGIHLPSIVWKLVPNTVDLGSVPSPVITGNEVPLADFDAARDLMAVTGSIGSVSRNLTSTLGPEPTLNVMTFVEMMQQFGVSMPVDVSGEMPLYLTSIVAEMLANA